VVIKLTGDSPYRQRQDPAKRQEILESHPLPANIDRELLAACIDTCGECNSSCTVCADASLAQAEVAEMRRSIRLCLDCADVCRRCEAACSRLLDKS
jgi:hypothetical protein